MSPAFQADALPSEPPGYPIILLNEESKLQNNMDSILPGFCLKKKMSLSPLQIFIRDRKGLEGSVNSGWPLGDESACICVNFMFPYF